MVILLLSISALLLLWCCMRCSRESFAAGYTPPQRGGGNSDHDYVANTKAQSAQPSNPHKVGFDLSNPNWAFRNMFASKV